MYSPLLPLLKDKEICEAIFNHASLGILVAGKGGEIIEMNSYMLEIFGYSSREELVGKKVEVLIPSRFHKQHEKHRDHYSHHPQNRPMGLGMDLFGVKKNGQEFSVELSLSHYRNGEANFTIVFVNDISRRKEIEKAVLEQKQQLAEINLKIEELNNELEQKVVLRTTQLEQAMKALEQSKEGLAEALSKEKELGDLKSRFVTMASHEFRTPLSTILSSASLLAKYTGGDEQEKRDKHIHRIKSSVHNLTDILNEFLSLGKIEDGKIITNYSHFDLKEMLAAIASEMQALARPGQQLKHTHTGGKEAHLDITLLRNIVINLLSNAIKFSPEKSIITIDSNVNGKEVSIVIKDAGIGISAEDKEHLFERFFRAKNAVNIQGTGLGLHIVGKYVELMNGTIECHSELEKGTSFTIKFVDEDL